jgi:hypothetical protein
MKFIQSLFIFCAIFWAFPKESVAASSLNQIDLKYKKEERLQQQCTEGCPIYDDMGNLLTTITSKFEDNHFIGFFDENNKKITLEEIQELVEKKQLEQNQNEKSETKIGNKAVSKKSIIHHEDLFDILEE